MTNNLVEILLGILLIFLVVGQPHMMQHYTRTSFGKVLFLCATIGAGYYSLKAGVLVALIYMSLHKDFMLVESMENKDEQEETPDHNLEAKYVRNGKDALELIKSQSFDIAVCSLKLPQQDGLELFKKKNETFQLFFAKPFLKSYFTFSASKISS